jgi:anti-sigma B factor antagonist
MDLVKPRISVEYGDEATVIAFTDEKILEDKDIHALQDSVMSVIDQASQIKLVLDFCNVRFLSSSVLGLLIRISKKVYERDGQLRLCNINPKIHEIFKITRLTKIFDIYPDVETAIESLANES